jgi:HSP20 family protein
MANERYLRNNRLPETTDRSLSSPQRRLSRFFDSFFGEFLPEWGLERNVQPPVNYVENDKEVRLSVQLPGVEEQDINVELVEGGLIVSGEREDERQSEEQGGRQYYEQSYGMFERFIPLGCEVEPEHVDASFRNGILTVVLPKAESSRQNTRRIPVRGTEQKGNGEEMRRGKDQTQQPQQPQQQQQQRGESGEQSPRTH